MPCKDAEELAIVMQKELLNISKQVIEVAKKVKENEENIIKIRKLMGMESN